MNEIPELTAEQLKSAVPASLRRRLVEGHFESGEDIAALRRFVGSPPVRFAAALGISIRTLRAWERGDSRPKGPERALLRMAARHPRFIRETLSGNR